MSVQEDHPFHHASEKEQELLSVERTLELASDLQFCPEGVLHVVVK